MARSTDPQAPAATPAPPFALVAAGVGVLYLALVLWFDWLCDDAYISFRYAQHLGEGLGLRFNPGSEPPVEGFSNLLWVLVLAPFEAAGLPSAGVSRVLSVGAGLGLLWCVHGELRRTVPDRPWTPAAGTLLLASCPPFFVWSTSGLATMPFAALLFGFWTSLRRSGSARWAVALAVGLVLVRAEGVLWALGLLGLEALRSRGPERGLRRYAAPAIAAVATLVVLTIFRQWYFGDPIPNTVRAKGSMSAIRVERGALYVASFFATFPHLALALGFATLAAGRSGADRIARLATVAVVWAGLLYAVAVGGDFMAMGRFLVPALPFLVIATAAGLPRLGRGPATATFAAGLTLSLLPAMDVHVVPGAVRDAGHFRWNFDEPPTEREQWEGMKTRAEDWAEAGRILARHTEPGESMIRAAIGAVGYYSGLVLYDQYGLVNPEVTRHELAAERRSAGHDHFVPMEYFLPREPTYWDFVVVHGPASPAQIAAFAEQQLDEPLPAAYRPRIEGLEPDDRGPRHLVLFQR